MSKYFIEDAEVTRVNLDDGQWVDVKSEFTQSDLDFISQSQIKIREINQSTKKAEVDFTFGEMAMLSRGVKAWSFELPVTPENISRLRNPMRGIVLRKLNELNSAERPILKN